MALATIISDHIHHARKLFFSHAKKACIRLVACGMRHECTCLRMRMPNGGFRHQISSGIFSCQCILFIPCLTCTSFSQNLARALRAHGACCMHVPACCMHIRSPCGIVALPIDPYGSIFMIHTKNGMYFLEFLARCHLPAHLGTGRMACCFRRLAADSGLSWLGVPSS